MEINLSAKTIETAANALRDAKRQAKQTMNRYENKLTPEHERKYKIAESQLADIEDALAVFEELEDSMY